MHVVNCDDLWFPECFVIHVHTRFLKQSQFEWLNTLFEWMRLNTEEKACFAEHPYKWRQGRILLPHFSFLTVVNSTKNLINANLIPSRKITLHCLICVFLSQPKHKQQRTKRTLSSWVCYVRRSHHNCYQDNSQCEPDICFKVTPRLLVLLIFGSRGLVCVCYLFLLLSSQLHLLLLLLQQQGGHVPLLRVRPQQLLPQTTQLVDHHQQLELLLCQRLGGTWRGWDVRLGYVTTYVVTIYQHFWKNTSKKQSFSQQNDAKQYFIKPGITFEIKQMMLIADFNIKKIQVCEIILPYISGIKVWTVSESWPFSCPAPTVLLSRSFSFQSAFSSFSMVGITVNRRQQAALDGVKNIFFVQ